MDNLIQTQSRFSGKCRTIIEVPEGVTSLDDIKVKTETVHSFIEYTIKATDSVKGIAKRFGVKLNELVKLNPQVCTPLPQMGIVLKIPMDHLEAYPVKTSLSTDAQSDFAEVITGYMVKLPDKSVYKVDKIVSIN